MGEFFGDVAVGDQIPWIDEPSRPDPREVGIARQFDTPDGGMAPPRTEAALSSRDFHSGTSASSLNSSTAAPFWIGRTGRRRRMIMDSRSMACWGGRLTSSRSFVRPFRVHHFRVVFEQAVVERA